MVSAEPPFSLRPRVFEIGSRERHQVEVRINIWTGEETYLVDGQERLRTGSWWGRRAFSVGERESHDVEVRVKSSGHVSVYVDRQLAEPNLFPALPMIPLVVIAGFAGLGAVASGSLMLPELVNWLRQVAM